MDDEIRLSRRNMLIGSVAVAVGFVSSCRTDPSAPATWPRFDDPEAVARLGAAALGVDASLASVGSNIRTAARGDAGVGRDVLTERLADDVAAARFVEVDGWILPESLAGLAADAAAETTGATGATDGGGGLPG